MVRVPAWSGEDPLSGHRLLYPLLGILGKSTNPIMKVCPEDLITSQAPAPLQHRHLGH